MIKKACTILILVFMFITLFLIFLKKPQTIEGNISSISSANTESVEQNSSVPSYTESVEQNSSIPSNTESVEQNSSVPSDTETICNIRKNIDVRVSEINNSINREYYNDHYDGDTLVFRYVMHEFDEESFAQYYMYYDNMGEIAYVDITHYRAAMYSIYFSNDKLLYTEVGPSKYNDPLFIRGGIEAVETIMEKTDRYNFVLEDVRICLENAYKKWRYLLIPWKNL